MFNTAAVPDWYLASAASSKPYGADWQNQARSALLIVPSVVARPERNILINPQHPEFPKITTSLHQPVWWDAHLFGP
jgi:RES domain-containing protein